MTALPLEDFAAIVGASNVLTGTDVSERFDAYPPMAPMDAGCILRPGSTHEVAAALAICNRLGLKVVPQGGRTGLVGGASTRPGDVAISLERMRAIQPIDDYGATVVVDAGVPIEHIQVAARRAGYLYPVDFGARGSATIGGSLATNAGGNSVLRYGMTRDQVLGLEVVLADGTILTSLSRLLKNNAGYDLKQIFIGSEGTLGIITRAVLKLQPAAGNRATALVGLATFADVLELLSLSRARSDGALTSFEVMWPSFLQCVLSSGRHARPLQAEHAFYVLVEVVSHRSDEILANIVEAAWHNAILADAIIAQSLEQADKFWAVRDDIEAVLNSLRPVFLYDVSLPQIHMDRYVDALRDELTSRWPGGNLVVFGHIADGNLHLCINTGSPTDHEAVDELVYSPLGEIGGSVSAEHGIGLEKRSYLQISRSSNEIVVMRKIKCALDPRNTLNPGKIFQSESANST